MVRDRSPSRFRPDSDEYWADHLAHYPVHKSVENLGDTWFDLSTRSHVPWIGRC